MTDYTLNSLFLLSFEREPTESLNRNFDEIISVSNVKPYCLLLISKLSQFTIWGRSSDGSYFNIIVYWA